MNVRLATPVALAAILLAAPSYAQCGYQSGTPQCFSFAPPIPEAGNIGEDLSLVSEKLKITGDIRFRSRNAWAPTGTPYATGDQISSRARLNFDFQVNANVRAFTQFNFSEVWPGSDPYSDADPNNTAAEFNGIAQAYLETKDLLGLGEGVRIGRSYYALASGLIYGSCDFLQYPAAGTGVWLSKEFGAHEVEVFGFDNNGTYTKNGLGNPAADGQRFVGATARIDLGNELASSLEPYVLFGTGDGDNVAAGNPDFSNDAWFGLASMGKFERYSWNAEVAQREVDATDDSFLAYRVNAYADLADLTGDVVNRVRVTRTDAEGRMQINPGDFNSAGLLHQYGGAWRSDLSTNQLALTFKPQDTLSIDVAYVNLDSLVTTGGENELDIMISKKLPDGAFGWIGYGIDDDERQVLYAQLTVFF